MSRGSGSFPGTVAPSSASARSMTYAPPLTAPCWAPLRGSCSKGILTQVLEFVVVFALGPHEKLSPVIFIRAGAS